jgi:hypothetical protein
MRCNCRLAPPKLSRANDLSNITSPGRLGESMDKVKRGMPGLFGALPRPLVTGASPNGMLSTDFYRFTQISGSVRTRCQESAFFCYGGEKLPACDIRVVSSALICEICENLWLIVPSGASIPRCTLQASALPVPRLISRSENDPL